MRYLFLLFAFINTTVSAASYSDLFAQPVHLNVVEEKPVWMNEYSENHFASCFRSDGDSVLYREYDRYIATNLALSVLNSADNRTSIVFNTMKDKRTLSNSVLNTTRNASYTAQTGIIKSLMIMPAVSVNQYKKHIVDSVIYDNNICVYVKR